MSLASEPPHILIADNDPRSRESLGELFEKLGWQYDLVDHSLAVLPALTSKGYDIIIADVAMPGFDAVELFDAIRQQRPSQAIIALSNDPSLDKSLEFFRSGATDVIPRPIDLSWLERIVSDVVHAVRRDFGEHDIYRFVKSEITELCLSCRDLAQTEVVSLPIVDRLRECGILSEGCALRLKLALQEAVINGFEHGNLELSSTWKEQLDDNGEDKFSAVRRQRLNDPFYADRLLHVRSHYDGASIEFVVRDEGRGFPAGSGEFREGLIPAGDLACSGRGLALMSSAVDVMSFRRNGAEVTLIKYLKFQRGA